ncbi:Angio-associated migratory cell [Brachionus plicatilis]|uniref:Angio-associated migratory cell n=1 Tax=Brachionus plicatilis TaxID=10195 RepID=A0A3M7RU88_BRAPC|nr:Angio-associated migratory cell [Brachionus plicatilis]
MTDKSQKTDPIEDEKEVAEEQVEVIEQDLYEEPEDELAEDLVEVDIDDLIEELEAEEDGQDDSIETIDKHDGAVFCIDSFKNFFATGGEDDLAYVFSYDPESKNIQELIKTDKFKDSVTNVKFSNDGKYVAISDMSGLIRVYTVETKSLHWTHDLDTDIESLDWHPNCNILFCSTSDGYFYMFKFSSEEIRIMYSGDDVGLGCFKILKDGKRAVTAYNNGNIRFWDIKPGQTLHNLLNAHQGDILSMDLSPDGNLLATGGLDMKLKLINTNNYKIVSELLCESKSESDDEAMEEDRDSIESVSFCKTLPLVACATLSGKIFIWDINSNVLRSKFDNSMVGYSKIAWNSQERLYASTLDGSLQDFDGRNLELSKTYKGHKAEILDFCLNEQSKIIYSASNDNFVKIFHLS